MAYCAVYIDIAYTVMHQGRDKTITGVLSRNLFYSQHFASINNRDADLVVKVVDAAIDLLLRFCITDNKREQQVVRLGSPMRTCQLTALIRV